MKEFSLLTKLYLYVMYAAGLTLFILNLIPMKFEQPVELGVLCLLASLALIVKVEGTTNRSHYAISFVVYAFTFVQMGLAAAMVTVVVSNLVAWLVLKTAWFIVLFNVACYIIVLQAAMLAFLWINPGGTLTTWQGVLSILVALALYTVLNHLMVGMIVWLARGENFAKAGTFNLLSLMIDMTLLSMGASVSIVWNYSHYAVLLFAIPLYLLYSSLKVPALERQVEIDPKTKLYNLYYFNNQLAHELKRAERFDRPISVVMADLDFLRNINNTYGHLAGDEILVAIANILKKSVREYDVVARFGGEEFSILFPEMSIANATERAEGMRKEIEEADFSISTSVQPVKVTMSFGIAGRENFGQSANEILNKADLALYQSKFQGRNQVTAIRGGEYIHYGKPSSSAITKNEVSEPARRIAEVAEVEPVQVEATQRPPLPSPDQPKKQEPIRNASIPAAPVTPAIRKSRTLPYIAGIVAVATALVYFVSFVHPYRVVLTTFNQVLGLLVFALFVISSEWFSIDIYIHNTAISTSAAPLLAGALLFGPVGTVVLSAAFAMTAFIKNRTPFSRFFFNAGNQIIACMVYLWFISLTGRTILDFGSLWQVVIVLASALVVFFITTSLVAVGISISLEQPFRQVWNDQFRWLAPFYGLIGLIAFAMLFGYHHEYIIGTLITILPLALLRYYQRQSIDRTREIVSELREKNVSLQKSTQEVSDLSHALLETLAEVIDLRDPYLSGHSRRVTHYAIQIAQRMGLSRNQIENISNSSLLHDIGKLGVPEALLGKVESLTSVEIQTLRRHPEMGAQLLEKSPSMQPLIPIVRYHHEYYDGRGYPCGLLGSDIPIEARIVSVADAIEAMASDRPYRKGRGVREIIAELKRCAGSQFDPQVVEIAIKMLEAGGESLVDRNRTTTSPHIVA
jgi:diguanylate cyclase (GGDEF)-like protein